MKERVMPLRFPMAGVARRYDFQNQGPPYSTPAAVNVRPDDTMLGRERGGSRPGLTKMFSQQLGAVGARKILMSADVTYITSNTIKTRCVFSANGVLYYEEPAGTLATLASALAISSTYRIQAVDRLQKLHIADWDPSAATSAAARAPKVWDPAAGTLVNWSTLITAGTLPTGCPCIALYRDRIFLASAYADPVQWYASRQGDPNDWDTAADDSGAAISGTASEAGRTGEPITCLAPHSNNCMLIGGHKSLWIMRGDPAFGGTIQPLSKEIGVLGRFAWCHAPAKVDAAGPRLFIYLSQDGLYVVPAGCDNDLTPQSMSRERLPEELLNLSPDTYDVSLAYSVKDRGVHIFVTPIAEGGTASHWWVDWETRGFFQVSVSESYDPITVVSRRNYFQSGTVEQQGDDIALACRDGYVRHFKRSVETDDGTNFSSYVDYGPFSGSQPGINDGLLAQLDVRLARNSNRVKVEVRRGETPEDAYNATAIRFTKTFREDGENHTVYPRVRGTHYLRFSNGQSGQRWGIEQVVSKVRDVGKK